LGADLLFRVKQDGDKLIIGKLLGSTFLGYYSLAFQIMLYPVTYVAAVIARVLFPTLSLLQNERDRLRLACLKAAGAVAFVTFPIMAGLFVVADDFVTTVFGTKWAPMIPLLRILCVVGALESIGATASTIFLSTGETRKMLRIALVSAPLTLVALALGLPWGLVGVTTSFALASVVFVYVNLHFALKVVGIRIRDLHFALLGPIATSAIMAVTVWFVKWVARSNFEAQTTIRLLLCVGTGVCVYALANLSFNRTQLMALWRLAIASARRQGVVET
jgi:PST family polysaccharide transporter